MSVFKDITRAYFIGIGGIGMSAIARYLNSTGIEVAGYDRVSTSLTDNLSREGIKIFFSEEREFIPEKFRDKNNVLIIYTPAIPESHDGFQYFRENDFRMIKRSEALGMIMKTNKGIAVAGTHGKTTVSSMLSHLLNNSDFAINAFLGGISKNLESNLLLTPDAEFTVVEADEYDRSFHHLFPHLAIVTSIDPDHLDIYDIYENLKAAFGQFVSQLNKDGILIYKEGLPLAEPEGVKAYTYSLNSSTADFYPFAEKREGFRYNFNLKTPSASVNSLRLNVYGRVNLENSIAACAAAWALGMDEKRIREALATYSGVYRRFDVRIENEKRIFIDDYAHHPEELRVFIASVREALPGKKITGVFQPHLYSRTRDFADGFATSLSALDHVILLDIYPAREKALPGVSSEMIYEKLHNAGEKILVSKEQLLKVIRELDPEVLLTMGAGDIDQMVRPVEKLLSEMNR
ncbi:MAG: UDP-N-acetylmuramate--L-alanine ligase [Bacteroidota bacterium]